MFLCASHVQPRLQGDMQMNMQKNMLIPVDETPIQKRDRLLVGWEVAKQSLDIAKENEMRLRKECAAIAFPDAVRGTNRIELYNGFSLKLVRKITYKLDKDLTKVRAVADAIAKIGNEGQFLLERLLKWKVELGEGDYNKLDERLENQAKIKALINTILTTDDSAPTLEIEAPKGKNEI
jgi:hypothetical protein